MEIPKITTFLMYNNQAEEAINLYTSLFDDSEIITMVKYDEDGPGEPGTVQHSIFTLNGQVFMAIDANSGQELPMNPAISLYVTVKDNAEMERLYNGLKKEGAILMPKTEMPPYKQFAWVQDKYGVSFQLAQEPPTKRNLS
ncbi:MULTISPECIES: VOC family protein [Staphylococcus]|jgi:predicted 3-demethylubiquinone-9 3-methyltransferase (glyoxalase superfamily)|nr:MULTISPECIES: VOC family protein [Staphylococcus]AMG62908.1 VOC family protein [Staphylococcus lugdunensis]ARB78018.1 VOC family protein [Staphylococcus lugdunensis]ARJ19138.1 VOC family protein [Staphylococcus lugdunensis]ARJ27635.1 VOC family protein [Staphylococcus lugdunensis]KAK55164.1 3-demethylubiquinone-9 3-methyltransferase domain protein [Staphylococcus lugdunensis VCU150]